MAGSVDFLLHQPILREEERSVQLNCLSNHCLTRHLTHFFALYIHISKYPFKNDSIQTITERKKFYLCLCYQTKLLQSGADIVNK